MLGFLVPDIGVEKRPLGLFRGAYIISSNELRYFSFYLSGDELSISDGGHVYSPEVGGDSYTNWMFTIWKDGSRDGNPLYLDKNLVKELIDLGAEINIEL